MTQIALTRTELKALNFKGWSSAISELNLIFDTINLVNDRKPRPHEVVFGGARPTKQ